MVNQDILNYIQTSTAQGSSRSGITQALIASGWLEADIEQAFASIPNVTSSADSQYSRPSSTPPVTEKNYPITKLWLFKSPIIITFISIIGLFFGVWFPYLILAAIIWLICNPIIRRNFHYSTADKFFMINQGVFSKKQRNVPYGVIQNVFVKQDLFDRIFRLASLQVEDATKGGGKAKNFQLTGYAGSSSGTIGSSGSKIHIPGLRKSDAEALKNILLQKMKENPVDTQSGL